MVLSGMGNTEMICDNVNAMDGFIPFTDEQMSLFDKAREIILQTRQIGCTSCNYCVNVCPKNIAIPTIFKEYNRYLSNKATFGEVKENILILPKKITDCISCGKCESVCSQNLKIRELLENINKKIERN